MMYRLPRLWSALWSCWWAQQPCLDRADTCARTLSHARDRLRGRKLRTQTGHSATGVDVSRSSMPTGC